MMTTIATTMKTWVMNDGDDEIGDNEDNGDDDDDDVTTTIVTKMVT
jgi:hypothetical protein